MRRSFYHNCLFAQTDRALQVSYRFQNPYRISKKFLLEKNAPDIHLYGETPLTTLHEIATRSGISSKDHVIELGCGRGRGANFLRHYMGCTVTGIESIPLFIEKAKRLELLDPEKRLQFICGDFLEQDLSKATVFYLYGTSLSDESIEQLLKQIVQALKAPIKVITVSFPLSDYSTYFSTEKSFSVHFPWGEADVFVNVHQI